MRSFRGKKLCINVYRVKSRLGLILVDSRHGSVAIPLTKSCIISLYLSLSPLSRMAQT